MTYQELLKEYAEAEGITMLNSFGHGHLLYRGEWFGSQFRSNVDPEAISEAMVNVMTGPTVDVSHLEL